MMKVGGREVTKEWYNYRPFEDVLSWLWESAAEEWRTGFTRERLLGIINSGELGDNLVATYSPEAGSVEIIMERYRNRSEVWFDVQNLCYHYSWQNKAGNFRSRRRMLTYLGGEGNDSKYTLYADSFE